MSDEVHPAHSLAEALCYLMATPCDACGKGPLRADEVGPATPFSSPLGKGKNRGVSERIVSIEATCAACDAATVFCFRVPADAPAFDTDAFAVVNPTDEPSRIIDVAQWIMLHQVCTESARKQSDRSRARRLNIEAARCLGEALKFYDEVSNDLPPLESLFHEASRRRFRRNPERFSRQRLVNLRAGLPTPVRGAQSDDDGSKRWWQWSQ